IIIMGKNKIKVSTFSFLKKAINVVFLIWMILIFIGSIRSTHLNITAVSPKLFTLISLLAICVVIYFMSNKVKSVINSKIMPYLLRHKLIILTAWSLILIIGQIIFISKTTTTIGFDVGGVVGEVLYGNAMPHYFSYNPNNLPLLFLEYFWGNHFGASWFSFNIMTLLSTDLG